MISHQLYNLARQGFTFPKSNTFANVAQAPHKRTFPARKVYVLRDFYGAGRLLRAGETVTLLEPDAADAVSLGRAEFV